MRKSARPTSRVRSPAWRGRDRLASAGFFPCALEGPRMMLFTMSTAGSKPDFLRGRRKVCKNSALSVRPVTLKAVVVSNS
eukprot:6184773-Alexandrium_andersonii.AAC.1